MANLDVYYNFFVIKDKRVKHNQHVISQMMQKIYYYYYYIKLSLKALVNCIVMSKYIQKSL